MRFNKGITAVIVAGLAIVAGTSHAQTPPPKPAAPAAAASANPVAPAAAASANAVAATVNGQPINESSIQRALKRVPPADHAKARPEILEFLIDNLLVEQYLVAQKTAVEPKEIQTRIGEIQEEVKKHQQDFAKMLQEFNLTEEQFRYEVTADLRWTKFANSRATEPVLKAMYDQNVDMFDGTMVRARHILLTPNAADPKAVEAAKATLVALKSGVNTAATTAVSKMPPTADPLMKEQARTKALEDAFAQAAEKYSTCPSKKEGGDISWFPRAGSMVEPFAKAAFALKPYEMSDVVQTAFGYHLILATGRKPGQATNFEKVKDEVKEVYCTKLRESLCAQLRQSAKIAITPPKS